MENENKPITREERQLIEIENRMARLQELRGNNALYDVRGYCYRETLGSEKTALPPVTDFLEDHQIGVMFGPGKYVVNYHFFGLDGDKKAQRSFTYNIGPEYAVLHREHCTQTGAPCWLDAQTRIPGISGQSESLLSVILSKDKLEGVAALLAMVRAFFPANSSNSDLKDILAENYKLLGTAIGAGKGQKNDTISDKIVELSVARMMEKPNPKKEMLEQLDFVNQIREMTAPAPYREEPPAMTEEKTGPFDKMINLAMEHLPAFLERFGGDEQRAAQQIKKENPAASIMLMNPSARKAFYSAMVTEHGQESADKWARGFGIDPATMRGAAKKKMDLTGAIAL